jgi:type IV secretion system protein VirB10
MKATTLFLLAMALTLPALAQSPPVPAGATEPPQPTAQPQAPAPATPPPAAAAPAPPDNSKILVPAETTIPLILNSTLNSRTAYVGQPIYCETIYPITVGNHMVIPVGSSVKGAVTQVVRPGRIKGRAQVGLRFEELVLPNGTTVPLRATLAGLGTAGKEGFNSNEGKIEGQSSKGKDAGTVARTTIPGAEIGTIVGAAKGAPLEGLGIGAGAGAATGLVWVLATRGQEVVLPRGTSLDLQLSAPITFNRDDLEPPSRYDGGPELPRREYGPRP